MDKVLRFALAAGAIGSVGFLLFAGRHSPRILLFLFTVWVLAPFVILGWGKTVSSNRPLVLLITLASLAIYGYVALGPPRTKVAPIFLMVPLASWVIIGVGLWPRLYKR